jgi:WD40 repeat protein
LRTEKEQWVELHDLATNKRKVLKLEATALSFAPDGKTFTTGSRDSTIRQWDMETLKPVEAR